MKLLKKGQYYGAKKSELYIKGVVLSEYDYLTTKTDWHFHENPYFMYVLQGKLFDVNKKQKTNCPSGSLVFHNWQEAHYNSKESMQARGFHIEFERSWFDSKKLDIELWKGSQLIENPRLHHLLAKLYYEFHCQDSYTELSIELLLLQLCEGLQLTQTHRIQSAPPWIKTLKDILHQNGENLSLTVLSEQLGVHPVHLSRSIPKYLSTTLGEYIRRQKIKQSLDYLINSPSSLTEIAYICGFADQSHFTRTFKQYFNLTPKAYRMQLRKQGRC